MSPIWKQSGMARRKASPPENPSGLYFAREHRDLSQDELAETSGVLKGTISKLENGSRKLTRQWAERFSAPLTMDPDRILFWDKFGPPEDQEHIPSEHVAHDLPAAELPRRVKLKGYVGASGEAVYYRVADDDLEEVEAPMGASDQTVAVEIRGKSFGPLLESWLVFYDDVRSPITDDLIGQVCVVGLADDRILIKKIQRNGRGGFTLMSNASEDPIEDAQIEWAAKVTDMKPRR